MFTCKVRVGKCARVGLGLWGLGGEGNSSHSFVTPGSDWLSVRQLRVWGLEFGVWGLGLGFRV